VLDVSFGFTIATAQGSTPNTGCGGGGSWWSVTIVSMPRSFKPAIVSKAEVPLSTLITSVAPAAWARWIEWSPNEYPSVMRFGMCHSALAPIRSNRRIKSDVPVTPSTS